MAGPPRWDEAARVEADTAGEATEAVVAAEVVAAEGAARGVAEEAAGDTTETKETNQNPNHNHPLFIIPSFLLGLKKNIFKTTFLYFHLSHFKDSCFAIL